MSVGEQIADPFEPPADAIGLGAASAEPSAELGTWTRTTLRVLAVLRIVLGVLFGWTFFDKTFGLGYATQSSQAWIGGNSPTRGFLASVDAGPLQSLFHAMAGAWWVDWLFMLGMLGVGIALIAGIALRPAAVVGIVIMGMMWLAEFPPARLTADGTPTGSSDPLVDEHIVYIAALLVLAVTEAGRAWGFGRFWARLPSIRDRRWMQ